MDHLRVFVCWHFQLVILPEILATRSTSVSASKQGSHPRVPEEAKLSSVVFFCNVSFGYDICSLGCWLDSERCCEISAVPSQWVRNDVNKKFSVIIRVRNVRNGNL